MLESDLAILFCKNNNINPDSIIKKKHGSSLEWTAKFFVETLLKAETGKEFIKIVGCGEQTFNRYAKSFLNPILGSMHGASQSWARMILHSIKYKKCNSCSNILHYSHYYFDSNNYANISSVCKICKAKQNALFYKENKDTYHKEYVDKNRRAYVARNALRRSRKLKATPNWANLDIIKSIYEYCEPGDHVDHIVPLVHPLVCGLHVEHNLQYLSAEENLQKNNSFVIE